MQWGFFYEKGWYKQWSHSASPLVQRSQRSREGFRIRMQAEMKRLDKGESRKTI